MSPLRGGPEFWGEVQPPASLKGLDILLAEPSSSPRNRAEGRRSEWETRLFVEEPMLSTGLHFASESTAPLFAFHKLKQICQATRVRRQRNGTRRETISQTPSQLHMPGL